MWIWKRWNDGPYEKLGNLTTKEMEVRLLLLVQICTDFENIFFKLKEENHLCQNGNSVFMLTNVPC